MKNQLKTIALLGGLSVLLVGIGALMGGANYIILFGGIAVAINFFSYFYSHKIVLAVNKAHPVQPHEAPDLHAMVQEVAERAGIPKPAVYIMDDEAPNAFATGRNPKHGVVAVTRGIMRILNQRELKGVIAHEMAHIKNRDILIASVAAMIATAIAIIASVAKFAAIFGGGRGGDDRGNPIAVLALAIVAPIAATIIQLAISRSREYHADATGAKFINDPEALASALQKLQRANERVHFHAVADTPATASLFICSPLSGKSVASWFSTHPPMEERIKRLMAMR